MSLSYIRHQVSFKVSGAIDILEVGFGFIGASDKVCPRGYRIVGDDFDALYADGGGCPGDNTGFYNFSLGGEAKVNAAQSVL